MTGEAIRADIAETPRVVDRALAANEAGLAAARTLLGGAALVRVMAIGSSRHAGGYAATAMEALAGWPATVTDAPGRGIPPPAWRPGDAVVVLSQSGRTPALVEAVSRARECGVRVVAIVNADASPLADLAHVVLSCGAGPERVVAATKTVTAQMALSRALASPLGDAGREHLLIGLAGALVVDTATAASSPLPRAVVAGGFAGGWVADEVAIKVAEVAGRSATGEPLVEHLHGPVAARVPVFALVDGDDPNLAGLPTSGTLRVGIDPAADVVVASTGDRSLDVLVRLVVAQRLVVAWAEAAGEDPDSARGLHKVTPTR